MTLVNQAKTRPRAAAATADTYQRKINELRYAIAFEEKYSKDWILSATSTSPTSVTAPTASRPPPGTTSPSRPRSSTCGEAALLAGLVKNPTGYDPTNYPSRAKERRNTVLARMAQLNVDLPLARPARPRAAGSG